MLLRCVNGFEESLEFNFVKFRQCKFKVLFLNVPYSSPLVPVLFTLHVSLALPCNTLFPPRPPSSSLAQILEILEEG
jgi:hypothetical protein